MNPNFEHDKNEAVQWAQNLLRREFVILDTETTGLYNAQAVQIAAIAETGKMLLNTLIQPTIPIDPEAIRIHGITNEMLGDAPSFPTMYKKIRRVLENESLVIYNAAYDWPIICNQCNEHRLEQIPIRTLVCAMEWYAQYTGEWNNWHQSYKWQRLPGGDHSALGDCQATLALIQKMANVTVSI